MSSRVFLVLLFPLGLFDAVHFGLVNDVDIQVAQLDINLIELLRPDEGVGQRVGNIAIGEIPLLLGQADQFFDLLRDLKTRLVPGRGWVGADGLGGGEGAVAWRELWAASCSPSIWP